MKREARRTTGVAALVLGLVCLLLASGCGEPSDENRDGDSTLSDGSASNDLGDGGANSEDGGTDMSEPPLGNDEPVYSSSQHLILQDSFDGYANMTAANAAYPVGRNTQFVELVAGRGGTGKALRLNYGDPGGADDILFGSEARWDGVGMWNGTLPEVAGPYTHFFFSTWFRFNGSNPCDNGGDGNGIKGFMFWTDEGRYEFAVNKIALEDDVCRGFKVFNPSNDGSGLNVWKTMDGVAPAWSAYNDNNWHRVTFELYAGNDPSGHRGARVWVDGSFIYDDVDVDLVTGQAPFEGYTYTRPIAYFHVWGNYATAVSAAFDLDFDDWIAWTD